MHVVAVTVQDMSNVTYGLTYMYVHTIQIKKKLTNPYTNVSLQREDLRTRLINR